MRQILCQTIDGDACPRQHVDEESRHSDGLEKHIETGKKENQITDRKLTLKHQITAIHQDDQLSARR